MNNVEGDEERFEWQVSHCNDAVDGGLVDQYAHIEIDGTLTCIDCPHEKGANCKLTDAKWKMCTPM